jgi:hypothetical protein
MAWPTCPRSRFGADRQLKTSPTRTKTLCVRKRSRWPDLILDETCVPDLISRGVLGPRRGSSTFATNGDRAISEACVSPSCGAKRPAASGISSCSV